MFRLRSIGLWAVILLIFWIDIAQAGMCPIKKEFVKKVASIAHEVPDFEIRVQLFDSTKFLEIWRNPELYQSDAIKFLGCRKRNTREKLIVGYAMQNLPLKEFLKFANELTDLRKQGYLNPKLYQSIVFPSYDWNTLLAENYGDADVQVFLMRLKVEKIFPESADRGIDTQYIDDLLSGRTAAYIKELRESGQLRCSVPCNR